MPLGVAVFSAAGLVALRGSDHSSLEVLGWIFGIISGLLALLSWLDNRRRSSADSSPTQIREAREMLRLLNAGYLGDEADLRGIAMHRLMPFTWRSLAPGTASSERRQVSSAADFADLLVDSHDSLTVVVGAQGSGKSVACLVAAQRLAERGAKDGTERVPVIVPADSWSPRYQSLADWAADWISKNYKQLRTSVTYGATAVEALVLQGAITLIIDGFEDVDEAHRGDVVRLLSTRPPALKVIISARLKEHHELLKLADRAGRQGHATRVVQLLPPDYDDVLEHLAASNPEWRDPGFRSASGKALRSVLSSLLGVALAREAYAARDSRPRELLDRHRFNDASSIRRHMWETMLPRTFRRGIEHRGRNAGRLRRKAHWPSRAIGRPWAPGPAMAWLRHLADHMSTSASEISWHDYHRSVGQAWFAPFVLLSGVLTATAFAVLSMLSSAHLPGHGILRFIAVTTGVWTLLAGPFTFALLRQFRYEPFADSVSGVSFLCGVIGAVTLSPAGGPAARVALGCQIWAATATLLQFGFRLEKRLRPRYMSPDKVLRAAGRHTLINALCVSVAFWLLFAVLPSLADGGTDGGSVRFDTMADGDIMLFSGMFSFVVTTSLVATHWGAFTSARLVSSTKGLLPFRLVQFLADASRMGILVRIGSSYYFKHADLRDFLRQA